MLVHLSIIEIYVNIYSLFFSKESYEKSVISKWIILLKSTSVGISLGGSSMNLIVLILGHCLKSSISKNGKLVKLIEFNSYFRFILQSKIACC